MAIQQGAADLLARLLVVSNPEVRAAAVFALGTLIQARPLAQPACCIFLCTGPPNSLQNAFRTT